MSLQVSGGDAGVIGRMFARRNIQDLYTRKRPAVEAAEEMGAAPVDRVDLSPQAPRPLSASYVESAAGTAQKLAGRGKLTSDETQSLREDRVFAAISTLIAVGADPDGGAGLKGWPGGIPAPTGAEMEAAYRRLAQRLDRVDDASDPETAKRGRSAVLEKVRNVDFGELAARMFSLVPALGGV